MICFHGTTTEGLKAILNGDTDKPNSPWSCSDNDGAMYFYPISKVARSNDLSDIEDLMHEGVSMALDNASLQSLFNDDTELFVIVCNIPKHLLEDDYSCENMADIASFTSCSDWDNRYIKQVFKLDLNKWLKPCLASQVLHNSQFNKWGLDENLLQIAELMSENGNYLEIDLTNYCEISLDDARMLVD